MPNAKGASLDPRLEARLAEPPARRPERLRLDVEAKDPAGRPLQPAGSSGGIDPISSASRGPIGERTRRPLSKIEADYLAPEAGPVGLASPEMHGVPDAFVPEGLAEVAVV